MRALPVLVAVVLTAPAVSAVVVHDGRADASLFARDAAAVALPGVDLVEGSVAGGDGAFEVRLRFADLGDGGRGGTDAAYVRFAAEALVRFPEGPLVHLYLGIERDGSVFAYAPSGGATVTSAAYEAAADEVVWTFASSHASAPDALGARAWLWQCSDGACERSAQGGYGGNGAFAAYDEMGTTETPAFVRVAV